MSLVSAKRRMLGNTLTFSRRFGKKMVHFRLRDQASAVVQTLRCFLQCKDVVLPITSDNDFDEFLHLLCTALAVGHWPSLSPDKVIA